jgi:hypothetical protein
MCFQSFGWFDAVGVGSCPSANLSVGSTSKRLVFSARSGPDAIRAVDVDEESI